MLQEKEVSQSQPATSKRNRKKWTLFTVAALLIVVLFGSFKPILKMIWGIRNARVENEQSLLSTATKYQLDPASIVTVDNEGYMKLFGMFHRSIPEGIIFDRQGNYLEYKESDKACNAGLFGFISALDKNGRYQANGKTTLDAALHPLRDLEGRPLAASFLDRAADFYLLISWSAFTGRLNKDHVSAWERLAAANPKARIQVIAVNLDAQQWWPANSRDSILKLFSF